MLRNAKAAVARIAAAPVIADRGPTTTPTDQNCAQATMPRRRTGLRFALTAVEYDYHHAADQAVRNGRADWAHALSTGTIKPH